MKTNFASSKTLPFNFNQAGFLTYLRVLPTKLWHETLYWEIFVTLALEFSFQLFVSFMVIAQIVSDYCAVLHEKLEGLIVSKISDDEMARGVQELRGTYIKLWQLVGRFSGNFGMILFVFHVMNIIRGCGAVGSLTTNANNRLYSVMHQVTVVVSAVCCNTVYWLPFIRAYETVSADSRVEWHHGGEVELQFSGSVF